MKKKFDAVEMKHVIQERQLKKLKGLSPTQESQFIQAEILKDDDLARFWKIAKRTAASRRS
ncbi:MAG: hypothetical protein WBK96_11305 [Candidatus Manganitrophaceae bacterium]